jgi:DNA-directed RNA polymerase subunit N (RpoN/RPB10)
MLTHKPPQTGNKWNPYLALLEQGNTEGEALDLLGLKR